MALTEKNQLLIAFKKLYGKTHTSAKFGVFNESIGSSVQVGASTIFGNTIPSSPSGSLYSITNNTVEKVKFDLVPISLSTYASTLGGLAGTTIDDEGDTATNGVHAYRLVLPTDYQSNSSNTKKGTSFFVNSATASVSNGALQLVPPSFGDIYTAQISSSSGIIGGLDDEDYYLDYYSGILFIQDIGRTPTAVTAYAYIGDYVTDLLSNINSDAITEVVAGTNLNGGGTSGSVTVSLADSISLSSVTASLYGTASYATNAGTASYALNAGQLGGIASSGYANLTASNTFTNNQTISGNLDVTGVITANELRITQTTVTVAYASGSTKFGDTADDTHQFSGSVYVSGNVTANNFIGTASYALSAATASYITSSNVANFTQDVRAQFNAGTNLSYATGTYALNNNISLDSVTASFSGNGSGITGVVSSSYATTASYAENTYFNTTQIQNAYKRVRYQEVGNFDITGSATIQLPTSSLGGLSFTTASMDYISIDVRILYNGTWVNDIIATTVYTSSGNVYVDISAPDLTNTDKYRLLATNEDPDYFTI